MLFLLLIILLFICVLAFETRKTFLSPTLIVGSVGVFCVFVAFIGNILFWNIPFRPVVVFIISIGMISMYVGEMMSLPLIKNRYVNNKGVKLGRFEIPRGLNLMLLLFCVSIDIYFYHFNKSLGLTMIQINQAANNSQIYYPKSLLLATRSVLAIGYTYIFILANNIVFRIKTNQNWRRTVEYMPIVISAFVCQILFSSRSGILSYLMFFTTSLLISLYRMSDGKIKKKDLYKVAPIIKKSVSIFFTFFLIMGVLMRKFSKGIRLLQLLIIYIGGGVLSFSLWFDSFLVRNPTEISETFEGVYSFLSKFGLNYNMKVAPNVWARWMDGSFSTNVFMGFKSYYYDWGILGVVLINFLVGYIYTKLISIAGDKKTGIVITLISTNLVSEIIYTFIGRTFSGMFTVAWWSYYFLIFVFSYLIIKKCKIIPVTSCYRNGKKIDY